MKKIKKLIKSGEDFNKLLDILILRVKDNMPISDNPMLDGLIISFMVSKEGFTRDLFLGEYMGRVLDGTLQQLEQISIWVMNNEDALCEIFKFATNEGNIEIGMASAMKTYDYSSEYILVKYN